MSLYRVPVEHNIYIEKALLLSALLLQYGGKVQENCKGNELSLLYFLVTREPIQYYERL